MTGDKIAIVGVACRLPGRVHDVSSLWRLLCSEGDAIGEVPEDRWSRGWYGGSTPRPGFTMTHEGGFIDALAFDAGYFELTEEEAAALDPQHRVLFELAIEAIDDAGLRADQIRGRRIGVFAGLSGVDAALIVARDLETVDQNHHQTKHYIGPNRLSNFLDLRGPSYSVDAACATSLVAIDLACKSIQLGECEAAIACAASTLLTPQATIGFSQLGTLSKRSRCSAFDEAADGYVRSEGGAAIVLKRLADAQRDGDRVYAIVRGSGTSHGGRNPLGTWAPRHDEQAALISRVLADAGASADEVSYVEAHGTGTQVGDREEALALSLALGKHRSSPLAVGSIKRQIGHLESAAGIAGLVKAIGVVHRNEVPPTPVDSPRNDIDMPALGLRVVTEVEPLDSGKRHLVGVNSFGVGGTYVHVLIESPPPAPALDGAVDGTDQLVPITARSTEALRARVAQLGEWSASDEAEPFVDLAYTLRARRTHHEYRTHVVASSHDELRTQLAEKQGHAALIPRTTPPVVFVFSGTGGQWSGMGRELLAREPIVRRTLEAFDRAWIALGESSLIAEMQLPEESTRIGSVTRYSTVAQVAVQAALADLWRAWGITPEQLVGHSLGELAAAYCASAVSLDELAMLAKVRCDWQDAIDGLGTMAAVGLSERATAEYLQAHAPELDIAGINAPNATTVTGAVDAIERLVGVLEREGVFARQLRVTVPFHSRHIRERRTALAARGPVLAPRSPAVRFVSTLLGRPFDGPLDAAYWLESFAQPVRFFSAVEHIVADGRDRCFLELGPHPVLSASIEECMQALRPSGASVVLPSLRRKQPERRTLLSSLGSLFEQGLVPDWSALGPRRARPARLPSYPWQHKQLLAEGESSRAFRMKVYEHPFTGTLRRDAAIATKLHGEARLLPRLLPYLVSHRIAGELLFPGAGFVETMREAAAVVLHTGEVELLDVSFESALVLDEHAAIHVRTTVDELERSITIFSSSDGRATWLPRARCRYRRAPHGDRPPTVAPLDGAAWHGTDAYDQIWASGYHFGPHFRSIQEYFKTPDRARSRIAIHDECTIDPVAAAVVALDAGFQTSRAAANRRYEDNLFVPRRVASIVFASRLDGVRRADAAITRSLFGTVSADITLYDEDDAPVAYITDYERLAVPTGTGPVWDAASWMYRPELVDAPNASNERRAPHDVRAIVVGAGSLLDALGDTLARAGIDLVHVESPTAAVDAARRTSGKRPVIVDLRWLELGSAPAQDDPVDLVSRLAWETVQEVATACGHAGEVELVFATTTSGDRRGVGWDALVALSRVVQAEHPQMKIRVIDVPRAAAAFTIADELLAADRECEVAWIAGRRHAVRVRRVDDRDGTPPSSSSMPLALSFDRQGSLFFRPLQRLALSPGEVRIAVDHASLNFRDVMKVMGIYPAEPGDPDATTIGDECSGTVVGVGPGVTRFSVGDAVVARYSGQCLATEVVIPEAYVFARPVSVSSAESAALPVVFTTAWYALRTLANLSTGQRVLIHSAAGGVGLAAIQIARLCGAEVYATAGSPEKQDYLRSLGVRHVFSSKSLEFGDRIREATNGEGVDVVLNSLVGPAMAESVSLLRSFGHFLEIGKRDLFGNTQLGLYPFRKNVSYHAVDLALVWKERPALAAAALQGVLDAIAGGAIQPLPTVEFSLDRVNDAFAHLRAGTHIGKVVVSCAGAERAGVPVKVHGRLHYGAMVKPTGSYLVTGGFGGLGRVVLEWLADAGAKHLVVISRSGASSQEARGTIEALAARGVTVDVRTGSVADAGFMQDLLAALRRSPHPVRGVFHLAGSLKDALVTDVSQEEVATVFEPKVRGAWLLDRFTRDDNLDMFLMFSSAATLGSAGQVVYAMANAFLDDLAARRREAGQHAQSIGWGVFLGGMMTEAVAEQRRKQGVIGMVASEVASFLDHLLPVDEPHVLVRSVEWGKFLHGTPPPRYAELATASATTGAQSESLRARLRSASPDTALELVQDYLRETIAKIRGTSSARIMATDTLGSSGFDSLGVINLINRITYDLGVTLKTFEVGLDATVDKLTSTIVERIDMSGGDGPAGREAPAPVAAGPQRVEPLPGQMRLFTGRFAVYEPDLMLPLVYSSERPLTDDVVGELLRAVTDRHDALRARFTPDGDRWTMHVMPSVVPAIQRRSIATTDDLVKVVVDDFETHRWSPAGDQIRAYVFEPGDTDRHLLVIAIDHLVFDHLSLSVLATEIQYLSSPSLRDRVPPVAISFAELATKIATLDTRSKEDELRQTITRMLGMGEVALQQPVRHVVPLGGVRQRTIHQIMSVLVQDELVFGSLQVSSGRRLHDLELSNMVGPLFHPVYRAVESYESPLGADTSAVINGKAFARVADALSEDEFRTMLSRMAIVNAIGAGGSDQAVEGATLRYEIPLTRRLYGDLFAKRNQLVETRHGPGTALQPFAMRLHVTPTEAVIVSRHPRFTADTLQRIRRALEQA